MKFLKALDLNDLFILAGAVLVTAGIWQIYRPAAFIASGLLFVSWGLAGARSKK